MKWESIKNNCVRQACTQFRNTHQTDISAIVVATMLSGDYKQDRTGTIRRMLAKEVEDEIVKIIDNWDIRQCAGLKNLYPECFPKVITAIELTDNGWEVI